MTNNEAIKMLRTIKRTVCLGNRKFHDALDMAISALAKDTNVPSDDTISRQDVIELVKNSYYDLAESIEDTWAMVADVEKLPSAQPDVPDTNVGDIISREVIPHRNYKYLSDYWCECGWHLGKKYEVKYCSDCGRKVNWDE